MNDNVNRPAHYTRWPVEVIRLAERETFLIGNILKYTLRAGAKAGSTYEEDMAKARWYARRHIDNIAACNPGPRAGLDSLQAHFADAEAYLTAQQEDTTEMREYLQDQLAAIYDQIEKELLETWDAT
nr:MAG TPA: nucelotide kinase [Caudoviricetes sp.]